MQHAVVTTTSGRMTVHAWAAMPEDEPGELCDGLLEDEEVADLTHETAVLWLGALLRTWASALGGFAFGSEVKFALSNIRGRKPDLSVFFPGRPPPPRRGPVSIPPDIAVEVVSPAPADQRRDRITKLTEYAIFGVRYYWILDPSARTFEILELGPDGRYVHVLGATEGTLSQVPGCTGLSLDLDDLWREIDRLGPEEPSRS
ncbi:MAG TPA: Uma2 family endonuclease [Kofleriaceae bacterium]|jgi:Uma2 family endonuclease|nr:Uma2 family endonuclease [Kofleriaceae bacterium]